MFGIDMEAYSVAYASDQGKCNWIIIKGVSDFGEPGAKIDNGALKAVTNAFSTTIAVIQDAVIPLFIQEAGSDVISETESTARDAYYEGDIDTEKAIAEKAFQRGIRTAKIRRRLLHGLLEADRFEEAERICSYLRNTKLLYDGNTAEYVAQMLSRRGRHTRALEIVNNCIERNDETIQSLYIGASSSYQIAESSTAYDHAALICERDFNNAISFIETAIERMENGRAQMPWLYVFGFFLYAIKARYADDTESNNNASIMKAKASAALEYRTSNHPNLAAAWFQRLLFFAMTKERTSFDELIVSKCGGSVSWTRLDSAFMRLESLRRHSTLAREEFDYYWGRLCQWVAQRAPRYGRPAQPITNRHLDDAMRTQ
jgi:tetratricopeptide (TPR) repeat protein